ncbi:MAG: transposase [Candidatus Omnitrophota bacterium]
MQSDAFVIMPNHIHGIIVIECPVGNGPARSVDENNNLSVVIGSYKSSVTKQINRINNAGFKWQKSFYDHIIRNDKSLNSIREYIVNNPLTWDKDENNPMNYKVTVQAGLNPTG